MRVQLGDTVVRTRPVTLIAERSEGDDMDMRVSGLGVPYETWTTLYDSRYDEHPRDHEPWVFPGVAEGFQYRRDVVPRPQPRERPGPPVQQHAGPQGARLTASTSPPRSTPKTRSRGRSTPR